MKKDNYRKILSEKFKAANQLETGPLTEEDEEYLRILAEARANHAKIKAARQEARKRLAARVAAVLIIAALVSSSYLLGMKSDSKASADPDDETKVVQQGDNIINGPGVSEEDEYVGVKRKTYYNIEDMPDSLKEKLCIVENKKYEFRKMQIIEAGDGTIEAAMQYFNSEDIVAIIQGKILDDKNSQTMIKDIRKEWMYKDFLIRHCTYDKENAYFISTENAKVIILAREGCSKTKIEAFLDDLVD